MKWIAFKKIDQIKTFFSFFVIVLLLSGCAHLVHLDKAQRAFNEGAQMENASRLGFADLDAEEQLNSFSETKLSPEFYYSLANAELDKALKTESKLEGDGVLASTLTLKSLCAWKLGEYGEASRFAESALAEMNKKNLNYPRDKALMAAMKGLIANDTVYDLIHEEIEAQAKRLAELPDDEAGKKEVYETCKAQFEKLVLGKNSGNNYNIAFAAQNIQEAIDGVSPPDHPVLNYLTTSQAAVMVNWRLHLTEMLKAARRTKQVESDRDWLEGQFKDFRAQRDNFLIQLERVMGSAGKKTHTYFKERLNVPSRI